MLQELAERRQMLVLVPDASLDEVESLLLDDAFFDVEQRFSTAKIRYPLGCGEAASLAERWSKDPSGIFTPLEPAFATELSETLCRAPLKAAR